MMSKSSKKFAFLMFSSLCVLGASKTANAVEIYSGIGTDGIGLGAGYSFGSFFNARTELDGMQISRNFSSGDTNYNAKLKVMHGGLYGDFFPIPYLFSLRVTGGLIVGGDNISGTATSSSGTYTINGTTVNANGESISVKYRYPTVRPYLGIGFGHNPLKRGLSFAFDAGVIYGKPSVSYDVPADIVAAAGQSNVDAEEQKLKAKANNLRFYPVIKASVVFRF